MTNFLLVCVIIMAVLAVLIFVSPMLFPGAKNKTSADKSFRKMIKFKLFCFLGILVLLLLCIIIPS